MIDREKGAHEWMIEFKKAQNAFTLSKILDDTLQF
jgi:hypothetical protein